MRWQIRWGSRDHANFDGWDFGPILGLFGSRGGSSGLLRHAEQAVRIQQLVSTGYEAQPRALCFDLRRRFEKSPDWRRLAAPLGARCQNPPSTELNNPLTELPKVVTAPTMAIATSPAMNAYSMAVTPASFPASFDASVQRQKRRGRRPRSPSGAPAGVTAPRKPALTWLVGARRRTRCRRALTGDRPYFARFRGCWRRC